MVDPPALEGLGDGVSMLLLMFSQVQAGQREAEGGDLEPDRVDVGLDDVFGRIVTEALRDDFEVVEEFVDGQARRAEAAPRVTENRVNSMGGTCLETVGGSDEGRCKR